MLHHRTTDPCKRAEHIADRLDKLYEQQGDYDAYIRDWPRYWLDAYGEVIKELQNNEIDPIDTNLKTW